MTDGFANVPIQVDERRVGLGKGFLACLLNLQQHFAKVLLGCEYVHHPSHSFYAFLIGKSPRLGGNCQPDVVASYEKFKTVLTHYTARLL
jgi:hypothetical protein